MPDWLKNALVLIGVVLVLWLVWSLVKVILTVVLWGAAIVLVAFGLRWLLDKYVF